jgi:deoxyribose-phosphate aldolase
MKYELIKESVDSVTVGDLGSYIDFYFLDEDIFKSDLHNLKEEIDKKEYRSIVTFIEYLDFFENFNCIKIGLLNYPPIRQNHRTLCKEFENITEYSIDEVEFVFDYSMISYGYEKWRKILYPTINKGIIVRAMIDIVNLNEDKIKKVINFLHHIGIYHVMTSTGLIEEQPSINQLKYTKSIIPKSMKLKCTNISSKKDIVQYYKIGYNYFATTKNLNF